MVLSVQEMGQRAKNVTSQVAMLSLEKRNALLQEMAQALLNQQKDIIIANQKDLSEHEQTLSGPMQKRLKLDADAIQDIANSLRAVAELPDPLAGPYDEWRTHVDLKNY
jgi:glutamate-5-semialdehyde dehydrogenase